MTPADPLREHLVKQLEGEAHAGFDAAIDGLPPSLRGATVTGVPYSPWALVEHMRRTQGDILAFCRNPSYVEPHWPDDYWPSASSPASDAAWDESVAAFRADLADMKALAADPSTDLFARVPIGTGQTFLREVLLVADHNAYHVGQLVLLRRALGAWPAS
jgi:DinB superfamily